MTWPEMFGNGVGIGLALIPVILKPTHEVQPAATQESDAAGIGIITRCTAGHPTDMGTHRTTRQRTLAFVVHLPGPIRPSLTEVREDSARALFG